MALTLMIQLQYILESFVFLVIGVCVLQVLDIWFPEFGSKRLESSTNPNQTKINACLMKATGEIKVASGRY